MEGGSTTDSRPEVLIVEDEESLAELFDTYLADEYIVKPVRNTHPTPRFPACVPDNTSPVGHLPFAPRYPPSPI